MGTKANPGAFDCYAKAEPDEPMFVLLARDGRSPYLVRIWAAIELGDSRAAEEAYNAMWEHWIGDAFESGEAHEKATRKAAEANACAEQMSRWKEHR